jgi:calcineurin-like phosphoesterase
MALDISYKNNFHSLTLKNTIYKLKEKYKGERILKNKSNPLDFIGIKEKLEKKKKNSGVQTFQQ